MDVLQELETKINTSLQLMKDVDRANELDESITALQTITSITVSLHPSLSPIINSMLSSVSLMLIGPKLANKISSNFINKVAIAVYIKGVYHENMD